MKVTKNVVVSFDYELTGEDGEVIDTSKGRAPLTYLHGAHHIVPGLEAGLEGKSAGDSFKVKVAPEDGYGLRDEARTQVVPRAQLPAEGELVPGMQFQAKTQHGFQVFTVLSVDGESVTLDGNHPLAGATLQFDVTVVELRAASAEELAHGHVHGPGGAHA